MRNITQKYQAFFLIVVILNFVVLLDQAAAEMSLSGQTLDTINAAVFEVVVTKPTKDSLKYKDPLPFSSIPFAIRNDKYYSIGTAFAIGPNLFVSAAHVMRLGAESQWGEPLLRDRKGSVYPIDQIVKFSERRDFIVFTLKDCQVNKPLEINMRPLLNQGVFAVGNALGQGVVVRDGLYTSDTPEPVEGLWKWLRFSAAASPGNSGGPLLDTDGKVIGIVLKKSPNENLNMALPIAEVMNAKNNMAHFHRDIRYSLPVMTRFKQRISESYLALPKSYQELNRAFVAYNNRDYFSVSRAYFTDELEHLFPNGAGSKTLLASSPSTIFPSLIRMKDDGLWEAQSSQTTSVDLGRNGSIVHGEMGSSVVFTLHKPDDTTLEQLYSDGKLFMDLVLRGIRFSRYVGESPIRITSLGSPQEGSTFSDYYGRKWLVRTWLREYDDTKLVTFSLPTPGGLMTLMRLGQTGFVDSYHIPTLKLLTNFINFSYSGTLQEWEEFLRQKDLLPSVIASLSISRNNAGFSYSSQRLSININNKVFTLSDKSLLALLMGYGIDNSIVTWDIASVMLAQDQSTKTLLAISRHPRPDRELNDEFHNFWKTIFTEKFPYNRSSYSSEGATRISAVVEAPVAKEPALLHSLLYLEEGTVSQEAMANKLGKILQGVTIKGPNSDEGKGEAAIKNVQLPFTDYSAVMQEDARSAIKYAFQGQIHEENGAHDRALQSFARAIAIDPRCPEAYFRRGIMYQNRQEDDRALIDYGTAIDLDPFTAHAYNNRGVIFLKRKQFDKALEEFDKAINADPKTVIAYLSRASIFTKNKQYDRALAENMKVLEIDPNNFAGNFNRGNIYRQRGDYEKAVADYDKAIQINEKATEVYLNRGALYEQRKEYDKALNDFNALLAIDANEAKGYYNRGNLYRQRGEHEKALADYNQAIQLNNTFADAYLGRGVLYEQIKERDKALSDYHKALEIDPNNHTGYYNRSLLYYRQGDYERALADYNQAIQLNDTFANAYWGRGVLYNQRKEYDKALNDFNTLLTIDAKHSTGYYIRGNLYRQKVDYEKALADYNKAIQINDKYANAYVGRGVLFVQKKEYDKALSDFNNALTIEQNNYEASVNRGNLFYLLGNYERALTDLNNAVKINDKIAHAYFIRSSLFQQRKEYDKALIDYNIALKIDPNNFTGYYNRGSLYRQLGAHEKALVDFDKAIQINNKSTDAYLNRGVVHAQRKEYDKAFRDYNIALKLEPKNANIWNSRGYTYFENKDFDNALADYNRALELDPKLAIAYQNRGNLYSQRKELSYACADWKKACELGACINLRNAQKSGACQ